MPDREETVAVVEMYVYHKRIDSIFRFLKAKNRIRCTPAEAAQIFQEFASKASELAKKSEVES